MILWIFCNIIHCNPNKGVQKSVSFNLEIPNINPFNFLFHQLPKFNAIVTMYSVSFVSNSTHSFLYDNNNNGLWPVTFELFYTHCPSKQRQEYQSAVSGISWRTTYTTHQETLVNQLNITRVDQQIRIFQWPMSIFGSQYALIFMQRIFPTLKIFPDKMT